MGVLRKAKLIHSHGDEGNTWAHLDGIEIVQELALRTQMMTTFEF